MKVAWHAPCPNLSQVPEDTVEFSWVSKDGRQCHPFVLCKDFLHDIIYATKREKAISICGLNYDPNIDPPACLAESLLLIAGQHEDLTLRIPKCLDFLNQVEKECGFKSSSVELIENTSKKYGKVWLFRSPKKYLLSHVFISLLSSCIRIGLGHTGGSYESTLAKDTYCSEDRPVMVSRLIKLLKDKVRPPCFPRNIPINELHYRGLCEYVRTRV